MAYFNNAFRKTFIMSEYIAPVAAPPATTATSGELTSGQLSLYDARQWTPLNVGAAGAGDEATTCQFVVASGAPYGSDRIGPFHGGYQESIKSKGINPKYISKIWTQRANPAQQSILHIGTTPFTAGDPNCCPTFLCGENYHLRVDVKGSPALRMLNRQAYQEVTAYTGCCEDDSIAPVAVNPAIVMLEWQRGIQESVILTGSGPNGRTNAEPFVIPVVTVTAAGSGGAVGNGTTLVYPAGTAPAVLLSAVAATNAFLGLVGPATVIATTADAYTPAAYTDECAGLTLVGAYEETRFGDCTFQPSDFYGTEPLRLFASEVDLNGDPCEFTGICIVNECEGKKPQGLGESVLRDFILSESYRQIPFATDLRIREITQGNDMLGTGPGQVDRTALYDRAFILHTIPRFNNPSGTFDNDQYLLDIAAPTGGAAGLNADIQALLADVQNTLIAAGNEDCIDYTQEAIVACDDPSVVVVAAAVAPIPPAEEIPPAAEDQQ
tara:strand:- start:15000 stop:16484 length:1485 start_codon:yes stop_codon:yes gene_type:complete